MIKNNVAKDKFLVLQIINIFQPVEKKRLLKLLRKEYNVSRINYLLKELIMDKRIVEESKKYRLTKFGLQTILPGDTRIIRDKYRMHYLYETWKNRGGA